MTEISRNGQAVPAVAAPTPATRRATTPAAATPANAKPETLVGTGAPAKGDTVSVDVRSAEPMSPSGPTRVTAYSDASSGRYVIQVREAETNDVINQYPPKELLRFYAAAREALERAVERSARAKDVSA